MLIPIRNIGAICSLDHLPACTVRCSPIASAMTVGSQPDAGEHGLQRVGGADVQPVLLGEVVEGHEVFPVPVQRIGRRRLALAPEPGGKIVADARAVLTGGRLVELVQLGADLGLQALGQLVLHVQQPVVPAALAMGLREDLLQSSPEAEVAVPDPEQRRAQTAIAEIAEHLCPAGLRLPVADLQGQQLLAAVPSGGHDREQAAVLLLQPGAQVDPVCPGVGVAPQVERPPVPGLVLLLPFLL
jgi:hypothetical protein